VIGTLGGIQSLDTRRTAFLPLSTARHRFDGLYDIKAIRLRVDHWTNTESVVAKVREILKGRHHSRIAESIRVYYYPERIKKVQSSISLIRILAVLAWSVILVIGGAGIAVLMVSAVRDRRREIGLKKAVGATNSSIRAQFLMEAVIVSCKGGIVGMTVGSVCCLILQLALGLQVSPLVFLVSISVGLVGAAGLGIAAGLYPATIACGMDPAISMRSD
jgi:putative ABC transport system permease protein